MSVDATAFKRGMRHLAASVTLITTRHRDLRESAAHGLEQCRAVAGRRRQTCVGFGACDRLTPDVSYMGRNSIASHVFAAAYNPLDARCRADP